MKRHFWVDGIEYAYYTDGRSGYYRVTPIHYPKDQAKARKESQERLDKLMDEACEKPENWHLRIARGFTKEDQ